MNIIDNYNCINLHLIDNENNNINNCNNQDNKLVNILEDSNNSHNKIIDNLKPKTNIIFNINKNFNQRKKYLNYLETLNNNVNTCKDIQRKKSYADINNKILETPINKLSKKELIRLEIIKARKLRNKISAKRSRDNVKYRLFYLESANKELKCQNYQLKESQNNLYDIYSIFDYNNKYIKLIDNKTVISTCNKCNNESIYTIDNEMFNKLNDIDTYNVNNTKYIDNINSKILSLNNSKQSNLNSYYNTLTTNSTYSATSTKNYDNSNSITCITNKENNNNNYNNNTPITIDYSANNNNNNNVNLHNNNNINSDFIISSFTNNDVYLNLDRQSTNSIFSTRYSMIFGVICIIAVIAFSNLNNINYYKKSNFNTYSDNINNDLNKRILNQKNLPIVSYNNSIKEIKTEDFKSFKQLYKNNNIKNDSNTQYNNNQILPSNILYNNLNLINDNLTNKELLSIIDYYKEFNSNNQNTITNLLKYDDNNICKDNYTNNKKYNYKDNFNNNYLMPVVDSYKNTNNNNIYLKDTEFNTNNNRIIIDKDKKLTSLYGNFFDKLMMKIDSTANNNNLNPVKSNYINPAFLVKYNVNGTNNILYDDNDSCYYLHMILNYNAIKSNINITDYKYENNYNSKDSDSIINNTWVELKCKVVEVNKIDVNSQISSKKDN